MQCLLFLNHDVAYIRLLLNSFLMCVSKKIIWEMSKSFLTSSRIKHIMFFCWQMKCCLPILNNQSSGTVLSVLSFLYSHALWACPLVMVNALVIKDLSLPEHSKSFLQFASFKRICDMSKSHIFWSSSRIKPKTHHVSLSAYEML